MNEIITLYLRTLCDSNYFCDFFQFIILTYKHELKNYQSSSFETLKNKLAKYSLKIMKDLYKIILNLK
jgi:hypothetical protein